MYYNSFDSYYYSRPVSYCSYNPRVVREEVLNSSLDPEAEELMNVLRQRGETEVSSLGGLARGIRIGDLQVGRRQYNHNSGAYSFNHAADQYYIRQWKPTNDLTHYHPTGTHLVLASFPDFINKLIAILDQRKLLLQK